MNQTIPPTADRLDSPPAEVRETRRDGEPEAPPDPTPTAVEVCVVIVNYRTPQLTLDCLDSLAPEVADRGDVQVVVVEGGSGDDSAPRLAAGIADRGYGRWVRLDARRENAGFAGGNNAAIVPAMAQDPPPRFVWLLNPDTVVRPAALQHLLDFMDQHPAAGIVGSRLEDPDTTPQASAFRFPSLVNTFESTLRLGPVSRLLKRRLTAMPIADRPHRADWLAGASLLVRREVIEAVGPLDEGYFMYFEETDFCLAAQRAGFECWYVPASRVVHLVGQASGVTAKQTAQQPAKRRPKYWFDSRKRYFVKNHGRLGAALADAAWIAGFAAWRLRVNLAGRRHDPDPPHMLADFIRHSVFVSGFGGHAARSGLHAETPRRQDVKEQ